MEYDVFISYARKDYVTEEGTVIPGNIVSQIKDVLMNNDISFWFDEEGVYSGDEFAKVIVQNIKKASIFLFISTKNSNASQWTSKEIATANHFKKKILPFRYDDTPYNDAVMLHIADLDYVSYQKNPQKAFSRLVLSIKDYLAYVKVNSQFRYDDATHMEKSDTAVNECTDRTEFNAKIDRNLNNGDKRKEAATKKRTILDLLKIKKVYLVIIGMSLLIVVVFVCTKFINRYLQHFHKTISHVYHDEGIYDVKWFEVNGVKFPMIKVQAGTFLMGDNDPNAIQHEVTLTKDYYIGQTEVTQELWKTVMGSNPSKFKGNDYPVDNVSWEDCIKFITRLNLSTNRKFRLPTEAEWEYATGGGSEDLDNPEILIDTIIKVKPVYSGNDTLSYVGWYKETGDEGTHAVRSKKPNKLGIYDMSGNLWEWCQDRYVPYSAEKVTDPVETGTGDKRVRRGGSWRDNSNCCRVTFRSRFKPDERREWHGFRLALDCLEN